MSEPRAAGDSASRKRERRRVPRARGNPLPFCLLGQQPWENSRSHQPCRIVPEDFHPNPCYSASARKKQNAIRFDYGPQLSPDGKKVSCESERSGGAAEQVTLSGGKVAFESVDGKTLFYTKSSDSSPLFAKPLAGGPERQIVDQVAFRAFAVFEDGIYYIGRRGENAMYPLAFYQFSTGKSRELARLTAHGLAVAPDRKTFLFSRSVAAGADLMLIENFR